MTRQFLQQLFGHLTEGCHLGWVMWNELLSNVCASSQRCLTVFTCLLTCSLSTHKNIHISHWCKVRCNFKESSISDWLSQCWRHFCLFHQMDQLFAASGTKYLECWVIGTEYNVYWFIIIPSINLWLYYQLANITGPDCIIDIFNYLINC